jgi:hypothetical protein
MQFLDGQPKRRLVTRNIQTVNQSVERASRDLASESTNESIDRWISQTVILSVDHPVAKMLLKSKYFVVIS